MNVHVSAIFRDQFGAFEGCLLATSQFALEPQRANIRHSCAARLALHLSFSEASEHGACNKLMIGCMCADNFAVKALTAPFRLVRSCASSKRASGCLRWATSGFTGHGQHRCVVTDNFMGGRRFQMYDLHIHCDATLAVAPVRRSFSCQHRWGCAQS
jgi:hypothetical protein